MGFSASSRAMCVIFAHVSLARAVTAGLAGMWKHVVPWLGAVLFLPCPARWLGPTPLPPAMLTVSDCSFVPS